MLLPYINESFSMYSNRVIWANKAYNYDSDSYIQEGLLKELYNEGVENIITSQIPQGELEEFFLGIRKEEVKKSKSIARYFYKMLKDSFNGGILLDLRLLKKKIKNIAIFSALKTAVLTQDILKGSKGLSDTEYLNKGIKEYNIFSGGYLAAEQDISFVNGRMAKSFKRFIDKKNTHPLLKYCTQLDNRVRPEHADLQGVLRPVEDKFWDVYTPPQGFNCRCFLRNVKEGRTTRDFELKRAIFLQEEKQRMNIERKEMDFKNNPYKTNYVFKPQGLGKHPYFNIANPSLVKEILKNMF